MSGVISHIDKSVSFSIQDITGEHTHAAKKFEDQILLGSRYVVDKFARLRPSAMTAGDMSSQQIERWNKGTYDTISVDRKSFDQLEKYADLLFPTETPQIELSGLAKSALH